MTTVGNVIDRLYREFLTPSAETPTLATLNGALTDADTSVAISTAMLAPDEKSSIGPGTTVEVGREQMLVVAFDQSTNVLTVRRGYNGTTAAAHADSAVVTSRPEFSRQVAFDAVADEIVAMGPTLWGKDTLTLTSAETPVEVPGNVIGLAALLWKPTGDHWRRGQAELLRDFPGSSTQKAIQFLGVPSGKDVYVTAKVEFVRPTDEDDLLVDLFVEEQWVSIVLYGAASRMSAYVDPTKLAIDSVTERDQSQLVPAGTGTVLERRLRSVRNDKLREANRRQDMEYPPVTTYTNPFNPSSLV